MTAATQYPARLFHLASDLKENVINVRAKRNAMPVNRCRGTMNKYARSEYDGIAGAKSGRHDKCQTITASYYSRRSHTFSNAVYKSKGRMRSILCNPQKIKGYRLQKIAVFQ